MTYQIFALALAFMEAQTPVEKATEAIIQKGFGALVVAVVAYFVLDFAEDFLFDREFEVRGVRVVGIATSVVFAAMLAYLFLKV